MVNVISPFQLQTAQQASELTNASSVQAAAPKSQTNFSDVLKNSIEALNQSQLKSDQYTNALAQGKDVNLDEVMIASQKASVTLTAATEFRNKAVEAYQEIMRMQM
ncbi:flagellar hook-basal body complex protein FliE [Bacillus altitudinis]|uniref:flagellar hook-basal body complex protein FliE n=1 Tax=Bacillus altitudinis TaxID=293387 RepID=UPI003D781451